MDDVTNETMKTSITAFSPCCTGRGSGRCRRRQRRCRSRLRSRRSRAPGHSASRQRSRGCAADRAHRERLAEDEREHPGRCEAKDTITNRPPDRYRPTLSGVSFSAARPIDLMPPMTTSHVSTATAMPDDPRRHAERSPHHERDRVGLRERRRRQGGDAGDERVDPGERRRFQAVAQVVHRARCAWAVARVAERHAEHGLRELDRRSRRSRSTRSRRARRARQRRCPRPRRRCCRCRSSPPGPS